MAEKFTVTLAIPCFNAELFIGQVLESIVAQTRQPDEIIIVDDGSSDDTRKIVSQFPNRLICHDSNKGIAAARNSAIKHASGDIIVFLDADALASPQYIEEMVAGFSGDDVAGVNGRAIESVQKTIYDKWRKEVLFQEWGNAHREEVYFLFGMCAAYRKKTLEEVGGFDELFRISGEDMDISYRIRKMGYRLAYTPKALVYHLREDSSETIRRMTFRHCFWGFIAQKKNHCNQNKISLSQSAGIFLRQLFLDGLLSGNLAFAALSLRLHFIILRAFVAARKTDPVEAAKLAGVQGTVKNFEWEGHWKK
ncbi:MAG: glycosyltransferase [Proteobacteria bacterium]|nr:glycosyltransferase [Pseudomonadota bacterium]